jgi:hypothetical protein
MLGFDGEGVWEDAAAVVGELAADDDNAEVDEAAAVERANDDVVLERTGMAVDSVIFALSFAVDWSKLSVAFTSRYAHPGTATPAGIGSGYELMDTMGQLADHTLQDRYVRP